MSRMENSLLGTDSTKQLNSTGITVSIVHPLSAHPWDYINRRGCSEKRQIRWN